MSAISWSFAGPALLGTKAQVVSVFCAAPVSKLKEFSFSNQVVDSGTTFMWSYDIGPLSTTNGFVAAHFIVSASTSPSPATVVARFGGQSMNTNVQQVATSGAHVFRVLAYIFVGNLTDFSGTTVVLDMSASGFSGSLNLAAQLVAFDGITGFDTISSSGSQDVVTSPINMDPDFAVSGALTSAEVAVLSSIGSTSINLTAPGYTLVLPGSPATIPAGAIALAWNFPTSPPLSAVVEAWPPVVASDLTSALPRIWPVEGDFTARSRAK